MKRFLILFLLASTVCFSQNEKFKQLDSLLEVLYSNHKFMGSIAISKEGKALYNKSVGYRNVNDTIKIKNTSQSKYRIGSITKTFTAVMVFQLIDENKISLEDKLSNFFPEIPNASKISIANLLNHSSGLYNITNAEDIEDWVYKPSVKKEMLGRIAKYDVGFQPSEKTSYSNTNYILLGYILEQIEENSYQTILKERIVNTLGLQNTYVGESINVSNKECKSYIYDEDNNNTLIESTETELSNPGGAGNIVSNTTDLTRFISGLFNNKLISRESLKMMITTNNNEICHGLFYGNIKGFDIYASEGTIDRFQSFIFYVPETQTAIALAANALNYNKINIMINALDISNGEAIILPEFNKL